jgi:hypothetical protein
MRRFVEVSGAYLLQSATSSLRKLAVYLKTSADYQKYGKASVSVEESHYRKILATSPPRSLSETPIFGSI